MPNYQKGRIYSIRSHQTEDIFIGSTTTPLSTRMAGHRKAYRTNAPYMLHDLKNILKYNDAYIELIEDYPCDYKEQLKRRENEIRREYLKRLEQQDDDKEYIRQYHDALEIYDIDETDTDTYIETKCLIIDEPETQKPNEPNT